jgi:O-antigen/teichoic acid export membrane protein
MPTRPARDGSLHILMYHRVIEPGQALGENQSVISATPAEFELQMRYLARRFRVVSAEEVLDALRSRRPLARHAVLLTFDDGYRDFGDTAWPILRRFGFPATLFVPTALPDVPGGRFWWDRLAGAFAAADRAVLSHTPCGHLELQTPASREKSLRTLRQHLKTIPHVQAMSLVEQFCSELGEPTDLPGSTHSWEELRALAADGVTVAAHTRTHPALTRLPAESARAEIRGAHEDLVREIGVSLPIFSYPFGDHNEEVTDLVRAEGFELAMTCLPGRNSLPVADPLRLRRTNITKRTNSRVFQVRMSDLGSQIDRVRLDWKRRRRNGSVTTIRMNGSGPAPTVTAPSTPVPPGPTRGSPTAAAAESSGRQRSYLRGSSLLLAGRLISVVLNLAVQVVTIRYLAKADYGALAYVLALVSMGSSTIHLGMDKALPRLIPIYFERGDYARTFGSIGLATANVWGLGLSLLFILFGFRHVIGGTLVTDPQALSLLLILIALSPVLAYTTILETLVAVFASPRDIFVRRHIVGPGLKLAVVLLVVATAGDVRMLAWGYLVGGMVGLLLYVGILLREWRKQDLIGYLRASRMILPIRELYGFSLPLLSTNALLILRTTMIVILLEYFGTLSAVAEYRAVYSVAGLNLVVYQAFYLLFVPVASRMFARQDPAAINALYWKTASWITILTFPVFAITCALAGPVTVLLFGEQYASAGTLLAVLALGHYFHAALGFNAAALRVHGKLRLIVAGDAAAAATAIALALLLIPRYGAFGAAVAAAGTLVLHNIFNHAALWLGQTGIRLVEPQFLRIYAGALLAMTVMVLIQRVATPSLPVSILIVGALSAMMVRYARRHLNVEATFPELVRIPVIRRLFT